MIDSKRSTTVLYELNRPIICEKVTEKVWKIVSSQTEKEVANHVSNVLIHEIGFQIREMVQLQCLNHCKKAK